MWLEIEVLLKETGINWKELGLDIKREFSRRMIQLEEIKYLQELIHDMQVLVFIDGTSVYIYGSYEDLRDKILHLQAEADEQDFKDL